MTKAERIKAHCKEVEVIIKREVATSDLVGLMNWARDLVNISALSAQNLSNAKLLWREREKLIFSEELTQLGSLSPSIAKTYVAGKVGELEALHEYAERLDRRLSYALDTVRTLISAVKSEMKNALA